MPLAANSSTWQNQREGDSSIAGSAAQVDTDSDEGPPTLYVNSTNIRSNTSSPIPHEANWSSGRPTQFASTVSQRNANLRASRRRIVN
ncbi:hypothetical protein SprV_0501854100 [Sparganum proliferum]